MNTGLLLIIAAVTAVMVTYAISKTKHPVVTAFRSAMCGTAALLLINLTAKATGCYIAFNWFTVFVSTFLSLPGVVGMLLLNIIFI
ncbi:MAG: hypothetical protein E7484_03750 [Ruminococcaceae bacterium]|nr:hypothetical protein [Oscillospiraceae bacterium]